MISFDFDDTLCFEVYNYGAWNYNTIQVANLELVEVFKFYKLFHKVGILTARSNSESNRREVESFCAKFGLEPDFFIYTNHQYKGDFAKKQNILLHYDDDNEHLESCIDCRIQVVDSKVTNAYKRYKGN